MNIEDPAPLFAAPDFFCYALHPRAPPLLSRRTLQPYTPLRKMPRQPKLPGFF